MKPIISANKMNLLAYTNKGKVFIQDPPPLKTLSQIVLDNEHEHRGAVTKSAVEESYQSFDLARVRPGDDKANTVIAWRWWPALTRARAIANALWFCRDDNEADKERHNG